MIDLRPTKCNLCGGRVIYTSNANIYNGKEYGSGRCYLCTKCGAYVGTHRPRPRIALGLLANANMRKGKMMCHDIFDSFWRHKPKQQKKRDDMYIWLSRQMEIPKSECHFGYFDIYQLRKAYKILLKVQNQKMKYDKYGYIYFEEE